MSTLMARVQTFADADLSGDERYGQELYDAYRAANWKITMRAICNIARMKRERPDVGLIELAWDDDGDTLRPVGYHAADYERPLGCGPDGLCVDGVDCWEARLSGEIAGFASDLVEDCEGMRSQFLSDRVPGTEMISDGVFLLDVDKILALPVDLLKAPVPVPHTVLMGAVVTDDDRGAALPATAP